MHPNVPSRSCSASAKLGIIHTHPCWTITAVLNRRSRRPLPPPPSTLLLATPAPPPTLRYLQSRRPNPPPFGLKTFESPRSRPLCPFQCQTFPARHSTRPTQPPNGSS